VHLSAIKLRGFKSFPDPVEVRLEPGVAVVVGPNGSGKSNVADAIVWAAGSLAPSELRAEKPDDVLFAGGAGRAGGDFCEVELLFDNTAGDGPVDYSELSVARRLHRGGEGQYLLNRTAVRRTDLVELLADLGLGSGMHSIIGQGRVEEVLASSPERRRELVEEAAGLGRFKRRRHRAELKLARVGVQVERARDLEEEVRKERFRQDLLFRLNTIEIPLPPLRERREDIGALAHHFLRRYTARYRKALAGFEPEALSALEAHPWPGNVRELDHTIERAALLGTGSRVALVDLGLRPAEATASLDEMPLDAVEKVLIRKALDRHDGNVSHAAKALGLSRSALYRRLQQHGF
jgi:hypothetical protein